ncbi:GNAT family N-acetyltransferase [Pedobacter hartonius]|uniref:Putative acetyltransferase n=1 Tax=Pedobacter hartonius TaxID=425514 RepID=A0A1H4GB00_9SPHI|nr:GNAT family N-acetyltransferase [Pedobacter hartonius]SEB06180.1 putative acetyltransferase [Pedobacter hartonius]
MTIRKLEKTDNEALAKLIREVFVEHDAPKEGTVYSDPTTDELFELFKEPRSVLWVAESGGSLAGCSGIFPTEGLPENCAELVKVYLSAAARGTGTGRLLMQKSISSAVELGYTQLYLESLSEFSKAVSIYEKLGFVRLDKPLLNSVHKTCNIWMLKDIS